jgi:hypothetical protein
MPGGGVNGGGRTSPSDCKAFSTLDIEHLDPDSIRFGRGIAADLAHGAVNPV